MEENKSLKKLFSDLYAGVPWTEIRLMDILQDVSAEQAAQRPIPNANTIWQLVQHCVSWRENVLLKLKGAEFKSAEDNYLSNPTDMSPAAWNDLLERLKHSEENWEIYLNDLDETELSAGYKPSQNKFTVYEVIHGILHHDNYHFGQITMLKKLILKP